MKSNIAAAILACATAAAVAETAFRGSQLPDFSPDDVDPDIDPVLDPATPLTPSGKNVSGKKLRKDFNRETKIHMPGHLREATGERRMPFTFEAFVGTAWLLIVGGMPLVIIASEGSQITKTQWTVSIITWVVFFGGFYLFTTTILFQSSHFEYVRCLTIVEAVYLMSQILTTVGYGDITPAFPRGQVFVGLYVFFAILIISNIVSEVSGLVVQRTAEFANRLRQTAEQKADKAAEAAITMGRDAAAATASKVKDSTTSLLSSARKGADTDRSAEDDAVDDGEEPETPPEETVPTESSPSVPAIEDEAPKVEYAGLTVAIVAYAAFCVAGWAFFVHYPGEGKSNLEGIYMSVITLSTVGFGAVTPATEGGKIFASFWMLFGTGALVNVVSKFTELTVNLKALERYNPDHKAQDQARLEELLGDMPDRLDYSEFLKVSLQRWKLMKKEEIKALEDLYQAAVDEEIEEDAKIPKSKIWEYCPPPAT